MCAKHYENPTMLSRVTAKNVGDVFFETHCVTLQSLDFTVNRFFMKLFRTSNIEIVQCCQTVFGFELPSVPLVTRYDKFIKKLACNPL